MPVSLNALRQIAGRRRLDADGDFDASAGVDSPEAEAAEYGSVAPLRIPMRDVEAARNPMASPRMDALRQLANGGRMMAEDETMLPGGAMVPIDDLEASGSMTDALWRKTRPDVYAAERQRPMMEDETMLPGGQFAPIDDLQARGAMTDALWRKTQPDVYRASRMHEAAPHRMDPRLAALEGIAGAGGATSAGSALYGAPGAGGASGAMPAVDALYGARGKAGGARDKYAMADDTMGAMRDPASDAEAQFDPANLPLPPVRSEAEAAEMLGTDADRFRYGAMEAEARAIDEERALRVAQERAEAARRMEDLRRHEAESDRYRAERRRALGL
jgi:hypothetical protein